MRRKRRKVALALGGGGARGIAHIGAIEELERRGFEITAVAGTSMGALVGGMYAAGKLEPFKRWLCALDRYKVFGLVDFAFSAEGLVKGDRVIRAMKELVPEVRIEELELPFAAVAADLLSGSEVVFERGGLYEAIRASIAIPSVFRPVHRDGMVPVDGGTVNLVPLNRVRRTKDDLLVAVNVSAPYRANPALRRSESFNFYKLLVASSQILQQRIAQTMNDLYRPEVLVQIPADSYGIFEFYRAAEIIEAGRLAASAALDDYAAGRASRGVRAGCVESEPEPAEA